MYRAALEKADWLVSHADSHIRPFKDLNGDTGFYVLKRHNSGKYKKITKTLLEKFEKALAGEKDRHIEDYKELVQERNVYSSVRTIEMLAYRKVYCCGAAGVPGVALCVPGG